MNAHWIDFLTTYHATLTENAEIQFLPNKEAGDNSLTAIAHLSVIKITGQDAAQFLQGQLTCNINESNESISFFSAFCNAKGRTISTLLLIKKADDFLLILPSELIEKVLQKLHMYVLRSKVQLSNASDEFCLMGVTTITAEALSPLPLPKSDFSVTQAEHIIIKCPSSHSRYLIISSVDPAISLWTELIQNNVFMIENSSQWIYQDISAGIPWLNQKSSEQYIPQMLNIDKLGGISFTKGCYTGQEIIARTHYLGKAKRELFVAETNKEIQIDNDTGVISNANQQVVAKILSLQTNNLNSRLLLIMQSADIEEELTLNNLNQDKIKLIRC